MPVKAKSLSAGNAIENERLEWDEDSYRLKNENPINNYDWSRHALNFEVINGEIKPLGSQEVHLYDRYQNVLKNIDFKEYKLVRLINRMHTSSLSCLAVLN